MCYSNSARKYILAVMSQCHQSCSVAAKAERRLYCQIRIDLLVPNFLIFDFGTGNNWDGPSQCVNWAVLDAPSNIVRWLAEGVLLVA